VGFLELAICCSLVPQNPKDDHQLKNKCGEHSCEASRMWLPLLFGDSIFVQRKQSDGIGELVSLEGLGSSSSSNYHV